MTAMLAIYATAMTVAWAVERASARMWRTNASESLEIAKDAGKLTDRLITDWEPRRTPRRTTAEDDW